MKGAKRGVLCGMLGVLLNLGTMRASLAEILAVVAPNGVCTLRSAPQGTHDATTVALGEEATALHGFATRLLADAAAMRLGPAREGVPHFGDWAYGWVQSYVTSYRILARGVIGLAQSVAVGGEGPLVARIAEEMAEPIRAEFRTRVLAPALRDGGFGADLAHIGAALDAAWADSLGRLAARLTALPTAPVGSAPTHRLHLAAAGQAMAPILVATAPSDPMALVAEDGTDGGAVFLRSMRPMAARLGAVVVRVSEAGSIVATGGAFGYALAGFPGTAMGIAGGVGASWALDWLFNKVDATLNRGAFEAQALDAIARAEQRLVTESARIAGRALTLRLAALDAGGACP